MIKVLINKYLNINQLLTTSLFPPLTEKNRYSIPHYFLSESFEFLKELDEDFDTGTFTHSKSLS